jgi:hypothetical protein
VPSLPLAPQENLSRHMRHGFALNAGSLLTNIPGGVTRVKFPDQVLDEGSEAPPDAPNAPTVRASLIPSSPGASESRCLPRFAAAPARLRPLGLRLRVAPAGRANTRGTPHRSPLAGSGDVADVNRTDQNAVGIHFFPQAVGDCAHCVLGRCVLARPAPGANSLRGVDDDDIGAAASTGGL